jgi:hypothetical protein
MNVHPPKFGAAMQHREDLAGVEKQRGVERTFHPLLVGEIHFGKHHRHQIALLDPYAVLTRENAANFDAQPQDRAAERLGALQLTLEVGSYRISGCRLPSPA